MFKFKTGQSKGATHVCKLCRKDIQSDFFNSDTGLCDACQIIAFSNVKTIMSTLPELQKKANSSKNADDRILYLRAILDLLYEYKIKYSDNEVDLIKQDIDDLIDDVVDCISQARID